MLISKIKTNYDVESVWVGILLNNKSYTIRYMVFYRPENNQELDSEMLKEFETAIIRKTVQS